MGGRKKQIYGVDNVIFTVPNSFEDIKLQTFSRLKVLGVAYKKGGNSQMRRQGTTVFQREIHPELLEVCRYSSGKWVASWESLEGKTRSKSFSINKYGEETAFNLAYKAREDAILRLNMLGAGYSPSHGK